MDTRKNEKTRPFIKYTSLLLFVYNACYVTTLIAIMQELQFSYGIPELIGTLMIILFVLLLFGIPLIGYGILLYYRDESMDYSPFAFIFNGVAFSFQALVHLPFMICVILTFGI